MSDSDLDWFLEQDCIYHEVLKTSDKIMLFTTFIDRTSVKDIDLQTDICNTVIAQRLSTEP